MEKKILIVSNFFYPELKPRAFRTWELTKGLCEKGYKVDLLLPNREIYKQNYKPLQGVRIFYSNESEIKSQKQNQKNQSNKTFKSQIKSFLKKIFFYFFPSEIYLSYNNNITKKIIGTEDQYDKIISISHPLSIHLSVALASFKNKKIAKSKLIAEFSDPPFKGNIKSVFPVNFLYIFLFSYVFDFFIIPTEKAVKKYTIFKDITKIKVIPQGFSIEEYKTATYKPNKIPTFAYAGNFYEDLRDPTYFMEFLKKVNTPFHFKIYISDNNPYRDYLINYKEFMKGEIEILNFVPREQLIYELSKYDFLINFDNENASMSPSKLIDYAISKRPILSFNSKTFQPNIFEEFLKKDYTNQVQIDLSKYDIKKIINDFINL